MATRDPWVFNRLTDVFVEPNPTISLTAPPENNIVLHAQGTEMLRVAEDGFYVRGIKLEQDDNEAKEVYNAFKQWLAWSLLNNQQ